VKLISYDFSVATLSWIIIELCGHLDLQRRVRSKVVGAFPQRDPEHEDLVNTMPLLDGVVHEALCLHPALPEAWRIVCLFVLNDT
jgi:cytochrome P450